MSNIRVDNFGPSAGGTLFSARGIAKAWANLNGTGTIALRDDENIGALTDNGAGDYTMAFTNNMANGNYSVPMSVEGASTSDADSVIGPRPGSSPSASQFRFIVHNASVGTQRDADYCMSAFMGDLA